MPPTPTETHLDPRRIRNIGIVAHIDAGKTTTTERILYYAGAIHRMGDVDKGNTTTDFYEEEQQRGITIFSAAVACHWNGHRVNIIDTPGHVDFTAEVERSLRVLDGAVVVFSAVEGVEAQSETVWRQANKYHVPRLCFINKMDRVGAEFDRVFQEIRERLEGNPLPVVVPVGSGPEGSMGEFRGIVDLLSMKFLKSSADDFGLEVQKLDIPEDVKTDVELWRETLFNNLADVDEPFAEAYMAHLEGAELPTETIVQAIRRATLANKAQAVLCGSSFKYVGVQRLLDAVVDFLPSPLDLPPVKGVHPRKDIEVVRPPDPEAPLAALLFKITGAQHGDLAFLRIYSGRLKAGSRVYNPGKDKKEICSRIYRIMADDKEALEIAEAGDIVGVVGFRDSVTGDTLCDAAHPILLERIEFPETVISMSIEPVSSADKGKLAETLASLARQDPTFNYRFNEETGETLISGMGELHLEIIKNRMLRDYKVNAKVGKPRVSYRETVRKPVHRVEGSIVRQTGGPGLFAKLWIDLEHAPQPKGAAPVAFVNKTKANAVPPEFLAAIENSIREACKSAGQTGSPLVDVRVTLVDGQTHETDSNELAFRFAAEDALRNAVEAAGTTLLEPIMRLEVTTPEEHLGDVTADLMARRAHITEINQRGRLKVIEAKAPLERMFGYANAVRSLSQGRAGFSMEPSEYAPAPDGLLESMIGL